MSRLCLASLVVALVGAALLAAPAAASGPSKGPAVIAGSASGPIHIAHGTTSQTVASMHVPVGRWAIWAALYADVTFSTGGSDVYCTLTAGSGRGTDKHTGAGGLERETDPLSLWTTSLSLVIAHTFPEGGGDVALKCKTGETLAFAHSVRLMAMHVGTLQRVKYGKGTIPSEGSGWTKVVYGTRDLPFDLPGQGQPVTDVLSIPLEAGSWWVRAAYTIGPPLNIGIPLPVVHCTLGLGAATDQLDSAVNDALGGPEQVDTLDLAVHTDGPGSATLTCHGDAKIRMAGVHLAAVRAGLMTIVSPDQHLSQAFGNGNPVLKYVARSGSTTLPGPAWVTVASLDLSADAWLLLGKANVIAHGSTVPLTCRLGTSGDWDTKTIYRERTQAVALAEAHDFRAAGKASIQCRSPGSESTNPHSSAARARFVAIRAGSIKDIAL